MRDDNLPTTDMTAHAEHAELNHPIDRHVEACNAVVCTRYAALVKVTRRDDPTCEDADCDPQECPDHWLDITPTHLAKAAPVLLAACEEARTLIEQLHEAWLDPQARRMTMDAVDEFWMYRLRPAIDAAKGER